MKQLSIRLLELSVLGLLACGGDPASTAGPRGSAGSGGDIARQPPTAGAPSTAGASGSPGGGTAAAKAGGGGSGAAGSAGSELGAAGLSRGGASAAGQGGGPSSGAGGKPEQAGGQAAGGSQAGSPASAADSPGAPATSPGGYGTGTTGGGNAKPILVNSLSTAQAAIDAYRGGGLVLQFTGKFNYSAITDPCVQHTLPAQSLEIKNKSDITIVGDQGSSANFGIHIAAASSNVIVRNMTIGLTPGGDASDIVSIEGMSSGVPKNIWIDHNEMFTSLVSCEGAGDTAFDGMIDVKKGADNVTVSYNYLHDHHKLSLNGYSDSDSAVRHISFEHNLFEKIGSRAPLQRHGYSHMLNNYFLDVSTSGINVRMGGYALIEGNFFEKVVNPVTARDSDEVGFWDLRANNLMKASDVAPGNPYGITWTAGDSGTVNATTWTTSAAFPVALGYSYTVQPFQCVHDGLRAVAGAGKGLATLRCK